MIRAMVRLMVIYGRPDDTDAFDRHYRDVHVPLAKQMPGLRQYTVSRGVTVVQGEDPVYLIAELDWDDMAALQAGVGSSVGRAAGADVAANLASGGVRNLRFNQSLVDALGTCTFANELYRTGGYSYGVVVPKEVVEREGLKEGEDTVRPAWRHAEPGRNVLAPLPASG